MWFEGRGEVGIKNEILPPIKNDEIEVAAQISAISSGTEKLILSGKVESDQALDTAFSSAGTLEFPFRYGYQMVGTISNVGKDFNASKFMGKRVFCFAPHGRIVRVPASQIVFLPEGISDCQAVLLANMETAVSLVWDANPLLGQDIGVFGQGIGGLFVTHLLSQMAMREVITIEPNTTRHPLS